jgi:hypothetical protein
MKVMRFLLGLAIGASAALLLAPKSGRELRQQLAGGFGGSLLNAAPDEYPQPEAVTDWGGPATAVVEATPEAEAEPEAETEPVAEPEPVAEAESAIVEGLVVEAAVTEEPIAVSAEPEERDEAPPSDDLRVRIDETRAVVEGELAEPFAEVAAEVAVEAQGAEIAEAVAEQAVVEAAVAEEVAEEAVAEEAVAEAIVSEAVAEEALTEAAVAEEVAEEAAAEAFAEEAVAEEAVAEAIVSEAVAEEAATEAVTAEIAVEEAAAEAVAEEAVAEESLAEQSEELTADASAAETAPREGGSIDQAEMRRRIEETRARLKAKAFDAMMSGEAALLSRDSGEKPVPTADDAGLDPETDTVIDESLSQEDF